MGVALADQHNQTSLGEAVQHPVSGIVYAGNRAHAIQVGRTDQAFG